ncbi:hypothetical protein POM88_051998 [Heracleum sosnowskyi]|uniref:DUF7769 domain-containing protein n=1 Tax=Heracleum sosnowskyi TaxID=360622 RepID=A0AAD8GSA6_9APIA|nr:hypothetical protein POM88_051998 [Heracleum sosnowskyi]
MKRKRGDKAKIASEWDLPSSTPRISRKNNRWDETPTPCRDVDSDAGGVTPTPKRQRSRWDETPVNMGCATPMALRNKSVKKIKMVTNEKRFAIYAILLQRSINGKLKKKTTRDVASIFSVSIRTVQRIWKRSRENTEDGVANVSHRETKNCGRKRIEIDIEQFRNIPLQQRTTLRSTASAMNMSTSLIYNNIRRGKIRRHSNSAKPLLTNQNKKARVHFCLSMLEENSLPNDPIFKDM